MENSGDGSVSKSRGDAQGLFEEEEEGRGRGRFLDETETGGSGAGREDTSTRMKR